MTNPVYIFDVDGVINDISSYEPDGRVLKQIAELLNKGRYISINTGRGYPWVKENIIAGIREYIAPDKLDHIFISAEMGGVTVTFSDGKEHDERTAFSLLPEQIEQVKQVYGSTKSKNVHWYEGKVSMATIDKPAGVEVAAFLAEAHEISDALQPIFADAHVKITVNPDSLDVTTIEAGKWAGAQLIHDWLQRTPAAGTKYFKCFGDNVSDYEMARFFAQRGHEVEFVFTGKDLGTVVHDPRVRLVKTEAHYSAGTYEFLHENQETLS